MNIRVSGFYSLKYIGVSEQEVDNRPEGGGFDVLNIIEIKGLGFSRFFVLDAGQPQKIETSFIIEKSGFHWNFLIITKIIIKM